MIFSDEIINHILSFRVCHPIANIISIFIKEYMDIGDHNILEYYHDNEYYNYSFIEWYFSCKKL